ncbi:MAG: cupin domain-containing protein [Desulfobacteraceae bacterium]|jgi:quercetin dioxygenase-like cupin family protein|nr:cupin domain-containing protein [Desulfobacteraceae bacterium]
MFSVHEDSGYHDVIEGVRMKTLVYGDNTLMVEFRLAKGADLPAHRHSHEQTGYLVSGRIDLTIDGVVHAVHPGDSWCIPGDAAHSAVAYADSVALEVFSPVREDYLP